MSKLAGLGQKVIEHLRDKTPGLVPDGLMVDMRKIKEKARSYFFLAKNTAIDKRREVFKSLHQLVKQQMRPVVEICEKLSAKQLQAMPWNIRRAADQITSHAWRYLLDVAHFTREHTMKIGKILSFHAQQVTCIKKGKVGKDKEFGRVFQLGRIKGNFLFALASTSLGMPNKHFFEPLPRALTSRACGDIWRGHPTISSSRQRVLEWHQPTRTRKAWRQGARLAATSKHQKHRDAARRRGPAKAAGPPSRDLCVHWPHKAWRAARQKSNEGRCSHVGSGLRLCIGVQLEAAEQLIRTGRPEAKRVA